MKVQAKVWTLAWDCEHGTDCRVFGSEVELLNYFKGVIFTQIADIQLPDADEIRRLLELDAIGDAYDLWQATYKDDLDTYNWGCEEIQVDLQIPALN